jgi:NAD+ kinase
MTKLHPEYTSYEFIPKVHHEVIDYIVTIGGDGTILYAAKEFVDHVPPLISFQRGSLGFMCRFPMKDISSVVERVADYHQGVISMPFDTAKLMRLECKICKFK